MTRNKLILFGAAISGALVLAGCVSTPESETSSASPSATPEVSMAPNVEPSPVPTAASVDRPTAGNISCDTMLEPLVSRALRATELVPAGRPWTQFGFEPTGAALECPWGYESENHSVTYYAWTALAEGEGAEFVALTQKNGYTATENEQGTWITDSRPAPPGGVILVTDEWIAMAPTAELIPAIVWTR